ncbi:MAG TPA: glycosyltransferase family 39 protein [Thermoanaerobaculia bacterium]|jgi:hypothetical protein
MDDRAQDARLDRLVTFALPLLLAWSFLLRAWMATPELTAARFWDERFGLENIHSLLTTGKLRPANAYHPSLSYLPQAALLAASEALHRATGNEAFGVLQGAKGFTPTAYLLCRLLQAVYGTLSLYLTFRLGQRLFSARVGLAGALLLAVVGWHIRQSVIFKPDILLVLTSLIAFLWSLDAAERPAWRGYLRAGGGIGLALASKYNAGPIALPLVVAAWAHGGWRDWRRWAWLALAALAAVAVFLIFNPYVVLDPRLYVKDFGETLSDYAAKGSRRRATHGTVAWHGLQSLLSESFHGPVVGSLALLGTASLAIAAVRGPRGEDSGPPPAQRIGRAMALSYVLGYALLYSLSTTNLSPHNWLMVTPFTALFAAWAASRLWRWLTARWPTLARPGVAAAVTAAVVALLILPANLFAYRTVVPTTWVQAQRYLTRSLQPLSGRIIYHERAERRLQFRSARRQKAIGREAARLDQVPPGALDRADAELFRSDRLSSGFYQRRVAAVGPRQVVRFEPAPFRTRGPSVTALVHPWQEVNRPLPLTLALAGSASGQMTGALPAGVAPGELVSLEVFLPRAWRKIGIGPLVLDGKPLALASPDANRQRLFTERFFVVEPGARLILQPRRPGGPGEGEIRIWLHRWQRPARRG